MRVVVALLAVLACGCGSSQAVRSTGAGATAATTNEPAAESTTTAVPMPVALAVNGVPAARFLAIARATSRAYLERHPWNIRVAIGSDRGAHALADRGGMTYNYGSTTPVWVLAFDGRFRCDANCRNSVSIPAFPRTAQTTSTTAAHPTPVSTIVLTLHLGTLQEDGNFGWIDHPVMMKTLGKVWQLTP